MRFIVTILVLAWAFAGCQTSPKRPTTNTPAPALNSAQKSNQIIYNDVTDAKGAIHKARSLSEEIDAKVIKWDSGR